MSIRPNRSDGTRDDSKEEIMGIGDRLSTLRELLDALKCLCARRKAPGPSDNPATIEREIHALRGRIRREMLRSRIACDENVTDDELVRELEAALLREEMRVHSRGQERGLEL